MKQLRNMAMVVMVLISLNVSGQNDLDNYLQTAAENNPGLKARFSEYLAALEKVPQVGTLPDPTVAFGYFIRPVETRLGPQQAKFSVSQMFPWFGTLEAKENAATQMARAKYEIFREAKSRLFYDVKSTWYNLYFINRAIEITRENIDILNTLQKMAIVKIEAGKASAVDEIRVEMEVLELENQLKLLQDKLQTHKIAFNNLIHAESLQKIEIAGYLKEDEINFSRKAILDSIRINNHQILNLEFIEASYEYQKIVAEKTGKPSFSVGLDYISVGESVNDMLSPGESGRDAVMFPMIGIKVPLYRKKYTSMVKETVLMQESVQSEKIEKVNVLENIYEKANADYKDANRRIEMHIRQLELSKKAMRILESEYATNDKNFEEILRMERQVLEHNLELEKAKTDLSASIAIINYLMGR